ncbi:MAG: hypothetical protein JWQ81_5855 [Amycolatopsis sp.]|jgi:hypothetical protein|uniref:hypothetical protein n=1 Tax=Amycolatopsis sp. TaxID=37632 RepID=UPI002627AB11|nr:hypothetical protein [Amycolatopsis sp.]MCU1685116.1 hypothetical protein [Amycolatopsis sp.]
MLGVLVGLIGVVLVIAAVLDVNARRKGYRLQGRGAWKLMKENQQNLRASRLDPHISRDGDWTGKSR